MGKARLGVKEAERSDALFGAVVEAALDAIVVIDRNGAIRSVNKATERIFGYTAAEWPAAMSRC